MLGWRKGVLAPVPYVQNLVPHHALYNYVRMQEVWWTGSAYRHGLRPVTPPDRRDRYITHCARTRLTRTLGHRHQMIGRNCWRCWPWPPRQTRRCRLVNRVNVPGRRSRRSRPTHRQPSTASRPGAGFIGLGPSHTESRTLGHKPMRRGPFRDMYWSVRGLLRGEES